MTISLSTLFQTVKGSLLAGGRHLQRGLQGGLRVTYKTPTSPVTQFDRAIEKAIMDLIRKRFPDHVFLAEESHYSNVKKMAKRSSLNYRWIIDPLDGTINFIHGVPQSGISVAVERAGVVWAGGVYDPFRKELFLAVKGKGATLNGRPIHVSKERKLVRSLLITGFPYDREKYADLYLSLVRAVMKRGIDIRRFGAAAQDMAWVACGRADGFWEYRLNPWDVAAGYLLVQEAGGRVSDFHGRPYNLDDPFETLATNGLIHPSLVRIFRRFLTRS
ncbi:MAG: inositol monophosphatase [Elusimicrobia bacterium]|nr:inositol monophosphatase [Candidatus Obscuribacterium magneticum]